MVITIIIFLVMLAALVFVHELGHFALAKWVGARVDEFALGFPPKIFGWKVGETEYVINSVPFGGYVKILGEDAVEEHADTGAASAMVADSGADSSRSLVNKSRPAQAAVMFAGVTANVIFAWFLLSIAFMIGMPASSDNYFNAPVNNPHISIVSVVADSPAAHAGLASGDAIVAIFDKTKGTVFSPTSIQDVQNAIADASGTLAISYVSDKEYSAADASALDQSLVKTVEVTATSGIADGRAAIGIGMDNVGIIKLGFVSAFVTGAKGTFYMVINTIEGIAGFFAGLFAGHAGFKNTLSQVSGPVGIAKMVGDARSFGFAYLLSFTALISINLAIINALPLPALDGGRIVVIAIEGILRRPLNPRAVNLTHTIGFMLLIGLMLVITINDILKLF